VTKFQRPIQTTMHGGNTWLVDAKGDVIADKIHGLPSRVMSAEALNQIVEIEHELWEAVRVIQGIVGSWETGDLAGAVTQADEFIETVMPTCPTCDETTQLDDDGVWCSNCHWRCGVEHGEQTEPNHR